MDNDEKLNENEINNSLKEKEYIFSEGIKQAHSIEVTAEIDTYTVSVTTDDGGIVEVNGSSEKYYCRFWSRSCNHCKTK